MQYTISYKNPLSHLVEIEISCSTLDKRQLDFLLPAWRPGRYELSNYASNIRGFEAVDHHNVSLEFRKINRNCWQVSTEGTKAIRVKYQYYAHELSAGGSLLDDQQLYLNFINCLMYLQDRLDDPCMVNLKLDQTFKVACGLPKRSPKQLIARDYYQLADSPLIASPRLKLWKFQQCGIAFHIWFMGSHRLHKPKVISAFKSFIKEQIDTMGDFPEPNYHFLFQIPGVKVYHGVEHSNSTVIALGPGKELHKDRYLDFLGVSSHELFHCWNIIKIRPKELVPYDFSKEVYFDTGFVAEGVTTYYGDLFLLRSGVIDQEQYFKELNNLFKRHFENESRHTASLVESSRELWVNGYGSPIDTEKVSIYTKGALVSLMLDLTIRLRTENLQSLDSVMQQLWGMYSSNYLGFSLSSFKQTCEDIAKCSLDNFFDHYVNGVVPLETQLSVLLENVGCRLKKYSSKQLSKKLFGFRAQKRNGKLTIVQIHPNARAYRKLSTGDSIINVNGKKPREKLNGLIEQGKSLKMTVERHGRKVKISLPPSKKTYFDQYRIVRLKQLSGDQKEAFDHWTKSVST